MVTINTFLLLLSSSSSFVNGICGVGYKLMSFRHIKHWKDGGNTVMANQ